MKITILYDNDTSISGVTADWGFSCLIEAYGKTILFDTGENGTILLDNMKALHVDPQTIDIVFISHSHFDHSGGLSAFLNVNSNVKIYAPIALRGIHRANDVNYVEQPLTFNTHFHTTGLLQEIEQSLVVDTDKGEIIIAGCSHPGVGHIIKTANEFGKPYAMIGGLHGFDDFDILETLTYICPTHCTRYKAKIQSLYPEKYIQGGVGEIIEL